QKRLPWHLAVPTNELSLSVRTITILATPIFPLQVATSRPFLATLRRIIYWSNSLHNCQTFRHRGFSIESTAFRPSCRLSSITFHTLGSWPSPSKEVPRKQTSIHSSVFSKPSLTETL